MSRSTSRKTSSASLVRSVLGLACGLLSLSLTGQISAAPSGIYSLSVARDNPNTAADERLAAIRSYDFVAGYTLRLFWTDLETAQGQYNFSVINEAISQVRALGQGLSLEVITGEEPAYVLAGAGATYLDHRGGTNPVPWDGFAKQRQAALFAALASHPVTGIDGINRPLRDDPTLLSLDSAPVGLNFGIRDLNSGIRNHPDYTQQRYVDAIVDGVAAATSAMPNDQHFVAFFAFHDGRPGVRVDTQIIQRLATLYNGPAQTELAFFIENLSDIGPVPQTTGVGPGNNLRTWADLGGETMMQALDSWLQHAPDRDAQLASRNPATGIRLGYENYGTRFFELYVADLDGAAAGATDATGRPLIDDLRYWNTLLTTVPEPGPAAILSLGLGTLALHRRRR